MKTNKTNDGREIIDFDGEVEIDFDGEYLYISEVGLPCDDSYVNEKKPN